jgi:hypothetical protein
MSSHAKADTLPTDPVKAGVELWRMYRQEPHVILLLCPGCCAEALVARALEASGLEDNAMCARAARTIRAISGRSRRVAR